MVSEYPLPCCGSCSCGDVGLSGMHWSAVGCNGSNEGYCVQAGAWSVAATASASAICPQALAAVSDQALVLGRSQSVFVQDFGPSYQNLIFCARPTKPKGTSQPKHQINRQTPSPLAGEGWGEGYYPRLWREGHLPAQPTGMPKLPGVPKRIPLPGGRLCRSPVFSCSLAYPCLKHANIRVQ